ncbi:hypothetical protein ABL78_6851 [Leptomonas seymouri]|uniref:peptidyl-tRNA hydrolase n=1 Tax=Leptomonas seymouri TaxID=5684 RepID=A0A0N1IHT0_LEPSE|nr:hypothetical protein ABL78_6851 [Leptomonas seymouri]|eukprot:KPI84095.1 hypothetical protein ABL78_6851 [Leptomonas seymouri]
MRRQRMKVASDVLRGAAEEKDADRTAASAAESVNRKGCDGEGVGSCNSSCSGSSWESKSSDTDDDDGDSEYEQMEELRLKMMFVVRHPVQPKMSAQEVAVLTASAGVELVELHQSSQSVASQSITETSDRCLVSRSTLLVYSPTEEDRQRWLQWYLWWTRIGCAKITLKCPDEATITEVMKAAEDKRLPVVYLYRSQSTSQDGVTSRKAVPSAFDEVVVVALGPAPSDVLQSVTGALKLFS